VSESLKRGHNSIGAQSAPPDSTEIIGVVRRSPNIDDGLTLR